jgi:mannose-6-phosphate isomerase-like protein (cupin superfamily)
MNREVIDKKITSVEQLNVSHNDPLTVLHLLTSEDTSDRSIALILITGENHLITNAAEATYIILAGDGYFTIGKGDQAKTRAVKNGDMVRIPAGIPYKDSVDNGKHMLMLCMNHPAYDPNKITVLD